MGFFCGKCRYESCSNVLVKVRQKKVKLIVEVASHKFLRNFIITFITCPNCGTEREVGRECIDY